ncbi:MAG: hypothetical protein K2M14_02210 [Muribaculaceae bacterium]|nr:hypothetical protein [Muribaculaceae bacterium]
MARLSLLILLLWQAVALVAEEAPDSLPDRPLTTTYRLGAGGMHALSTYLTPIPHTGATFALEGEWRRALSGSRPLEQTWHAGFDMGFLQDAAGASAMTDVGLELCWNMQRRFRPVRDLTLTAGAGLLLEGGLLYLPRNSNNPVAARASVNLTLNAGADYSFKLWGYPLRAFEQVSLPSLGVFFSPHYGQSYYEIYLGDRNGLARSGWWGNHFLIDNLVGLEVPVCGIRLQLGYGLSVKSSFASDINTRITSHRCVIGISTDWINVTRRK